MIEKGISYLEPIRRLNEAFSNPHVGQVLAHEQLRAVTQTDDARHSRIVRSWLIDLRKRGHTPMVIRGAGVKFLNGREDGKDIDHKTWLAGKRHKRLKKRAERLNITGFSEAELAEHNLRKRNLDAGDRYYAEINKPKPPPPPVLADNVRVLKKT